MSTPPVRRPTMSVRPAVHRVDSFGRCRRGPAAVRQTRAACEVRDIPRATTQNGTSAGAESTGLRLPTTVERSSLLAKALAGRSGGEWCRACAFCMGYATKRPQPGSTHRRISPSHRLHVISHRASTAIHWDARSQRRLHSGHVHCLCITMHAFSVEAARQSVVVLVGTSRACCRSQHHPGRLFAPVPTPRVGPTARSLGFAPTSPAPPAASPLAGVELLGRVVEKVRLHLGRSGSACTGPLARQHVRAEETPRGRIEVPAAYFERVCLLPAARSHSAGGNRAPSLPGLVRTSS